MIIKIVATIAPIMMNEAVGGQGRGFEDSRRGEDRRRLRGVYIVLIWKGCCPTTYQ